MDKIQIGIACGENSEAYTAFLINTAMATVSNKSSLQFLLGVTSPKVNRNYLDKLGKEADVLIVNLQRDLPYSSLAHGLALDELLNKVDAPYGMLVDCDVAFLKCGWDEDLKSVLQDRVAIVGTPYNKGTEKFQNFPTIFATLFLPDVLKSVGVSFKPDLTDNADPLSPLREKVIDEEEAKYFAYKEGRKILLDTSWELPVKLKKSGYKGVVFESLIASESNAIFGHPKIRGDEFHFKGEPIFTHLGRSSFRDFGINRHAIFWEDQVRAWFINKYGIQLPAVSSNHSFPLFRRLWNKFFTREQY